jgi:spore coat protein CotF
MATTTKKNTTTKGKTSVKSKTATKPTQKCNCWTEQAQDACKLTDYDIISDVLGSHKNLIKLYGTALCEIGCEDLRSIVEDKMSECAEDQFDAFLYMNARGMYKTEPATVQKVKEARQKFCSTANKMEK